MQKPAHPPMADPSQQRPAEPRAQPPRCWYALAVHARQEKAAAVAIGKLGLEVYLPLRQERRPWTDRIKTVELALFPGYLFVNAALDGDSLRQMLSVRQVYDLVGRRQKQAQAEATQAHGQRAPSQRAGVQPLPRQRKAAPAAAPNAAPPNAALASPIPEHEIEGLRRVVESQQAYDCVARFTPGDEIEVGAGPFKGVRGVVVEAADGSRRLIAQIALLGRGVRVRLHADDLL